MVLLKFLIKFIIAVVLIIAVVALIQLSAILLFDKTTVEPQKTDLIIVFPGGNERINTALELAEMGIGSNLSVVGSTATHLQQLAGDHTIDPSVHMINGGESHSTFEDVLKAQQIIQQNKFKSLMLVTSSYHMPRAIYLLKTHFALSGISLEIRHYSVKTDESYTIKEKAKIYYNEMVKLWGSTIELICYATTGTLPTDHKSYNNAIDRLRAYLLFNI